MRPVSIGRVFFGDGGLSFILGPCVIESEAMTLETALAIKEITEKLGIGAVFKASYDKANRTSINSFRGPGLSKGLEILARVKEESGLPVLTDIHLPQEAEPSARVVDALQIPAFLVRQTDLLLAAGKTGLPVNLKKSQFMAPGDMLHPARKIESTGNNQVLLTERGTFFGYHDLVVDMRSLGIMRELGYPVIFDATHSVQSPGGLGNASGGHRESIRPLARAAVAFGVDGIFMEVHPSPQDALSDPATQFRLSELEGFLSELLDLHRVSGTSREDV
ncbi:MAG: 3-deoxy-8-phosphooctulonate synthase [candidate division WOR-3 bacterium]